jgi:GT2 family glycosyltransferase
VLVANETNLGFTGGNNLSISYALSRTTPADYLFLLNNDVLLEPDCLTQLVAADRAADAGLVGAVLRPRSELAPEKPERHGAEANEQVDGARANAQGGGAGSRNAWKPMGYVSGGAVLVRKDLLEAVRKVQGTYLDDRLFLYVEDVALSLAAQQLGYKTVQATRAVGYHTAGTSSGGRYSPIEYYYGTRNSIRVAALRPRSERLRFHAMFPWEAAGRVAKSLIYARPRSALAVVLGFLDGYRGVTGRWQDHDRQALKGPR